MRVLELTAHVQSLSRATGRTATAAAAYRACARIACEREGMVHDYRKKDGLQATGIAAPNDAPAWAWDRSRLWNAVEQRERNGPRGANAGAWKMEAMVAREVLFGFPAELSAAGRKALADRIARHLVDTHGVAVDWAIHAPGKLGDQRNHHCHMMFTTRQMTAAGLGAKTREWNCREAGRRTVASFRATLAAAMNEALAVEGHGAAVHVEHRSLKARGLGNAATKHQGPGRTNAGRQRAARERAVWERQQRQNQADRQAHERSTQARDQADRAELRRREIDRREARAIEQARQAGPSPEAAKVPPGRWQRLAQLVTGRSGQAPELAAPARSEAGHAQREHAAGEIRVAHQAERDRITADHHRESKSLANRHQAEDRQLDRAALARVERDRGMEVRDRRDQADGRVLERAGRLPPDERQRQ